MVKISVCIPAYNRSLFLKPLIDSILVQSYPVYEIVICEDKSPEREKIRDIVSEINDSLPSNHKIKYYENESNLGYDKNFRNLLELSTGEYCLFMGNDDILMPDAVRNVANVVTEFPDVAVISRAYQYFLGDISNVQDTVRHLPNDKLFNPGLESIQFFFRRVGVLSGLVFKRELANKISSDKFDGHLYYQMYITGMLLKNNCGYYISNVQTLSRDGISPDFGNSIAERNKFKPGQYNYESRVHMVDGLLKIADYIDDSQKKEVYKIIRKDLANYFYPYIRDQLNLPIKLFVRMVIDFSRSGMKPEPMFYFHCIIGYMLKKKGYDYLIKLIRKVLGHSPRLGF